MFVKKLIFIFKSLKKVSLGVAIGRWRTIRNNFSANQIADVKINNSYWSVSIARARASETSNQAADTAHASNNNIKIKLRYFCKSSHFLFRYFLKKSWIVPGF